MNDPEALLVLGAGSREERDEAIRILYDRHHARLAATVANWFLVDELTASVGAAAALYELHRDSKKEVPKLLDKAGEPWRWLLRRALDRTVDEVRRNRRVATGVPDHLKTSVDQEPLDDTVEHSNPEPAPDTAAMSTEGCSLLRVSVLEFLSTLQGLDLRIMLHDIVHRYDILSESEVEQFDDELVEKCHPEFFTAPAVKRQRSRLNERFRDFLRKRGHQ